MANYFTSVTRGSDSTGTGTASNPWKTIDKAIGSGAAITLSGSGDTLYVEPGLYRGEVALSLTPSAGSPLTIVGDCDGAGFLAGGYSSPVTGLVDWRDWTDDYTSGSIALTVNNAPYVTIRNLKIYGGSSYNGGCLQITGTSTNFTAQDCVFVAFYNAYAVRASIPYSAGAWNMTFDRCDFQLGTVGALNIQAQNNTTEYGLGLLIQNCRFVGRGNGIVVATTGGGAGTNLGTGITVQSCSFAQCGNAVQVYTANAVTMATPIKVRGCTVMFCANACNAKNTSMIDEDYNAFTAAGNGLNTTAGANTKLGVCPAFDFGDARLTGLSYRPFGEPSAASVFVGLGAGATPPSVDINNQTRPGTPSCGAFEIDSFPSPGGPFGGSISCY